MTDDFLNQFLPGAAFAHVRRAIWLANQDTAIALRQPILFLGEPGVGKTFAAKLSAAHRQWQKQPVRNRDLYLRREQNWPALTFKKFAEVSLPAIPTSLVESVLFGHVKGAFTGAGSDQEGVFGSQEAEDVLLDEIGDVPLDVQPKLLQVIQSGVFRPVGAKLEASVQTSIRVLMATNLNLASLVRTNRFREDLYWRVCQVVVELPPLRSHPDDIPAIVEGVRLALVKEIGATNATAERALMARHLEAADMTWAQSYNWPGNSREVERLIRLWLIEPSRLPLADIVVGHPLAGLQEIADAEVLLRGGVKAWLHEILAGARKAPSTVGELLKQMERVLQETVGDSRLTADDLRTLFPGQSVENARSRISRYRGAGREVGE